MGKWTEASDVKRLRELEEENALATFITNLKRSGFEITVT